MQNVDQQVQNPNPKDEDFGDKEFINPGNTRRAEQVAAPIQRNANRNRPFQGRQDFQPVQGATAQEAKEKSLKNSSPPLPTEVEDSEENNTEPTTSEHTASEQTTSEQQESEHTESEEHDLDHPDYEEHESEQYESEEPLSESPSAEQQNDEESPIRGTMVK
ncbi:submandibular gland secretory Glx-rich protein CA-like [Capsicum annuum]|uniref:submandibular gland secretory Glx-rich protein CA-like n=1 Tax=Capsicum annuum TaxID=4072 RepID=UPI001FB191C2|nr:submandibular gland secretory Glx-rich protein CA-like [Capsicum annuum]